VPYDDYVIWMRLTHNGRRGRDEMSADEQVEYDALKASRNGELLEGSFEEAKLAYEEATGRSGPASGPSSS
jgi:hypothetical protein